MRPGFAHLSAEEQGFVLGTLLLGLPAAHGRGLTGGSAAACTAALDPLLAAPRSARLAATAALAGAVARPAPGALEDLHPGWALEALQGLPPELAQALAAALPEPLRASVREALPPAEPLRLAPDLLVELQRLAFAGLQPLLVVLPATLGPLAARWLALPAAALPGALAQEGATTLGRSLAGAPVEVVARAMAGVGEALAPLVRAAAQAPIAAPDRAWARAAVAATAAAPGAGAAPAERLGALGARALAQALEGADGGPAVRARLAARLEPRLGRLLLGSGGGLLQSGGGPLQT